MRATSVFAPHAWSTATGPALFLAGSIEMGVAELWQDRVTTELAPYPVTILNPRRPDWDASWRQSIDDPQFRQQVEWELDGLDRAALIAMYFDPATRSPITMLELGLHAAGGKLIVACPDGFWRKGNLEVVCARHAVPLLADLDALIAALHARVPGLP